MQYTIMHRRAGATRFSLLGFWSSNLSYMEELAQNEVDSGKYTSAKIIEARTGKFIRKVNKSTK